MWVQFSGEVDFCKVSYLHNTRVWIWIIAVNHLKTSKFNKAFEFSMTSSYYSYNVRTSWNSSEQWSASIEVCACFYNGVWFPVYEFEFCRAFDKKFVFDKSQYVFISIPLSRFSYHILHSCFWELFQSICIVWSKVEWPCPVKTKFVLEQLNNKSQRTHISIITLTKHLTTLLLRSRVKRSSSFWFRVRVYLT